MATDIGAIKGVIELQDEFSSRLNLAQTVLSNFDKSTQESMKAIAGVTGIVTAAVTALVTATAKLGERGADVNDVRDTFEHFAGGPDAALASLERLRQGTKETITDFELTKNAAHLLSAGVNLTADDFGTLGSAAFVLQNRGLGGTKEMLDLVSDAMVTGRTRALAMALGVVEGTNAEEKYAATLGIKKEQLSDVGKVEAKRIEIMQMLGAAVKDAGKQERDFGEQLEAAKTGLMNWLDNLSSAVAKSPAFAAGMREAEAAIKAAFGGDQQESIKMVVEFLKQTIIVAANVALGFVETARVIHTVWSGVSVVINGTMTLVTTFFDMIASGWAMVAEIGAKLHLVPPGVAEEIRNVQVQLKAMSDSYAEQTAEAMKGVTGNSEFDKTLDRLGGTIMNVRDAVANADAVQVENNKTVDIAAANASKLAATQRELSKEMIDRAKVEDELWKVQSKSLEETSKLWEEYFKLRVEGSGTTADAQKASIQAWRNDEIAKLDDSDKNWKEHYDAINAVADEKLKNMASDWDSVKDKSIEALKQIADRARQTYDDMLHGSLHFTRDALDEQLAKIAAADNAVRGLGNDTVAAMNAAAAATQKQNDKLAAQKKAADDAAAANRALGGSFTYDLSTQEGINQYRKMNPAAEITWSDAQIMAYIKKGGTLEGLIKSGVILPYAHMGTGPRAAEGADVLVGEEGPEVVRLPVGARVYPTGTGPWPGGAGGSVINNTFNVNGTARDSANQIFKILMDQLKSQKKFSAATF